MRITKLKSVFRKTLFSFVMLKGVFRNTLFFCNAIRELGPSCAAAGLRHTKFQLEILRIETPPKSF